MPKLWSGPLGKEPEEISKALEEVRKGTALLLYGDETTFHLLPVLRRMWMKVGEQAKILTPSGWNRAFSVFGALNTVSGELFWEIFDRKNSDNFIIFLERLLSAHPDKIVHFVVDRASYHIINCCIALSCGQKRFPLFELILALEFKPQNLILEP